MVEPAPTKFRAIIVGAGPVGLFLAHALSKANIDYIVLEQFDSVIRYRGAGLLLYPQTLRLLDQLGVYDKAGEDFVVLDRQTDLLASNGRVIKSTPLWSMLGQRHGYPMTGTSRAHLIELLYESLPEKETRVKTGAALLNIEARENGVTVYLKDGSIEHGSVVLGVDGVHSKTRQIMQQQLAHTPLDRFPMTATYQGFFGRFEKLPGFEPGTFYMARNTGFVSQIVTRPKKGHFIILRPLPPGAESRRYTREERDHFAEEIANYVVGGDIRFRDIWAVTDKETAVMVNQEEGYCDKWYHERVALAGDAVAKTTSITGLGVNIGINTAAVLANELNRVVQSEANPSTKAIEDAFARYQQIRAPEASRIHAFGVKQVRGVAWETWRDWIWDRIINPWISVETVAGVVSKLIQRGQILDYVPFTDREVQVPWKRSPPA